MKFPVNSLLAGNFGFRDEFARDCLLQQRVRCELDFLDHAPGRTKGLRLELLKSLARLPDADALPARLAHHRDLRDFRGGGRLRPPIAQGHGSMPIHSQRQRDSWQAQHAAHPVRSSDRVEGCGAACFGMGSITHVRTGDTKR